MTLSRAIDAHVHVWTRDLERFPLAAGFSMDRMCPRSFTPEELLSVAQPLGVNRHVLVQMDFYGFDNSYLLDAIQRFPGVFSGIAQVDANGSDPAAEMRRLKALGVRGVRISPPQPANETWLDGAGMRAIWKCAGDEQMAVCPLINADDLPAIQRLCAVFPTTPVVIDHCARIRSGQPFTELQLQQLCKLAALPRTYVKLSAFYFLAADPSYLSLLPIIRRLCKAFGPQRLMWGSDSPFQLQPPHRYATALELIADHLDSANPTEREWLMERTAEGLFFA